jgi:CheY-like chemotaxis protein
MNVVLNAFDALEGEPGEVAVSTRVVDAASHPPTHLAPGFSPVRAGRFVVLEVRDDGHGISREDMRRIFEPFFSTKSKGKGRGLGLSATRGAVLNAGGVLEVESVVGAGTSMRLWFPALDVAPELDVVSDVAEHRVDIGEATVLVVDDERSVADMVDRVLSRGGLDVHTAYSATDALAICDALEATPRLAFIDYTMPDMFGDALAAKLRERYPDIGIILLSGYSVEHTDAALDRGTFDAFIAKPFEPEHLAHVARAHLEE